MLGEVIKDTKEQIEKFPKLRKEFIEILNRYDSENKTTNFAKQKNKIANLRKKVMKLKFQKENENIATKIKVLNDKILKLQNEIKELNSKNNTYDSKKKTIDFAEQKNKIANLKKLKSKKRKINKKITNEFDTEIKKLNNKILKLQDEIHLEKDKIINTNFAKKIITNSKLDTQEAKAIDIIKQSETLELVEENIINEKGIFSDELREFLKIYKPLTQLQEYFTKVNLFMAEYKNTLNNFFSGKIKIEEAKLSLEKLEQKEILDSLKNAKDTYNKLSPKINPKYRDELLKLFNKQKTKITKLTTASDSFPSGTYSLKTPFGSVTVFSTGTKELMIYPNGKNIAPSYDSIVYNLDQLFETENSIEDILSQVIEPIIKYLKQKIEIKDIEKIFKNKDGKLNLKLDNQKCQEFLNKIDSCEINTTILNETQKTCAAVLCGILMLSESHDIRNPTFGELERHAIKNVKYLANLTKKGCINPFEKTFSNKIGRYAPAHDITSDSSLEDKESVSGGRKQTQLVLGCIVDNEQNIHILKDSLPEKFTGKSQEIIKEILSILNTNKLNRLKKEISKIWNCDNDSSFKKTFNESISKVKPKCEEIIAKLNQTKTSNQKTNIQKLIKNFQLLKFQKQINSASDKNKFNGITKKNYIKISDLPQNEKIDKFDFGGIFKTPKKFFSDQIIKNMKKLYKIQKRTLTTKMLKDLK